MLEEIVPGCNENLDFALEYKSDLFILTTLLDSEKSIELMLDIIVIQQTNIEKL